MHKCLTAGELKRALYDVPDDVPVVLSSDTGVDQGMGEVVVLSAHYYNYPRSNIREFSIYANDMGDSDEDWCS